MVQLLSLLSLSALVAGILAHPVANTKDVTKPSQYLAATAASLSACSKSANFAAVREAAVKRRSELLSSLRARASQRRRRDTATSLSTDHRSSLTGLSSDADPAVLFDSSVRCILEPDVTEGPYFVSGEAIRTNIVDGQEGLPLYLDLLFVNSATCEPIPSLYVNVWHANSTGVYSGVIASGNGDSTDTSNLFKTNHRGIYPTDDNGVVQFTSTFPGHYTGRTTHIHISTASGGTVLPNNTYTNAVYSHVGQLFFDQSVINAVEQLYPYSTNTQSLTTNAVDGIFATSSASTFDPVLTYAYVDDDISNGILAWASMAIDTSSTISVTAAVFYSGNSTTTSSSTSSSSSSSSPGNSNPRTRPSSSPSASPSTSP